MQTCDLMYVTDTYWSFQFVSTKNCTVSIHLDILLMPTLHNTHHRMILEAHTHTHTRGVDVGYIGGYAKKKRRAQLKTPPWRKRKLLDQIRFFVRVFVSFVRIWTKDLSNFFRAQERKSPSSPIYSVVGCAKPQPYEQE